MMRSRKLVMILVMYVPVMALIAVGAWHILGQVNRLMRHADRVIEAELSRRWNR